MQIEKLPNYNIIYPDTNMVLTDWNKEDILDFTYTKVQLITPHNYDTSNLYEITVEECDLLQEQQIKRLRELENERENR